MTATRRWCTVALGVVILVSLPIAINALPARDTTVSAEELLGMAQQSSDLSYSGLVESQGALRLPVSDQFTDVADLLGEQTTMRVWWRSADHWRVDQVATTGETDLFHDAGGTTVWDYESNEATRTPNADIRLPQALICSRLSSRAGCSKTPTLVRSAGSLQTAWPAFPLPD